MACARDTLFAPLVLYLPPAPSSLPWRLTAWSAPGGREWRVLAQVCKEAGERGQSIFSPGSLPAR